LSSSMSAAEEASGLPTIALIIICVIIVVLAVSLYLWSRWSSREAAYEPEELSEEEKAAYRLGTALGFDGNIASGNH